MKSQKKNIMMKMMMTVTMTKATTPTTMKMMMYRAHNQGAKM